MMITSQMITMKNLRFLTRNDWTDDNGILPDFPRRVSIDINIADIIFTSSNALKQLRNLKVNSSAGPDGIKPFFFIRMLPTVWRIR